MNVDLIDRKKILRKLSKMPETDCDNFPVMLSVKEVKAMIQREPVAFDTNKIVEQLENHSHWTLQTYDEDGYGNDDSNEVIYLSTAVKIILSGGDYNERD